MRVHGKAWGALRAWGNRLWMATLARQSSSCSPCHNAFICRPRPSRRPTPPPARPTQACSHSCTTTRVLPVCSPCAPHPLLPHSTVGPQVVTCLCTAGPLSSPVARWQPPVCVPGPPGCALPLPCAPSALSSTRRGSMCGGGQVGGIVGGKTGVGGGGVLKPQAFLCVSSLLTQ